MAYATYEFYTTTYLGNAIASNEFDRLILRASSYIDQITGGRASTYSPAEAVSMAACAVVEAWRINEQGGELQSQTVGPWSRTYAVQGKSNEARLLEAVNLYLGEIVQLVRWC